MNILLTGGAGFIGSNFVRYLRKHHPEYRVVVLDALTYAGNLANLDGLGFVQVRGIGDGRGLIADPAWKSQCVFSRNDVCNGMAVRTVIDACAIDAIVHFAAESHVDRSIHNAAPFIRTNVLGTQVLLDAAREAKVKRFVHVSTDEVFGDLAPTAPAASETAPLRPSSPYAASKAAADLLVLAAVRTHGLPAVVTRCSNNYGPRQFPEKFIPLLILRAMAGETMPIYGDGMQVRDWIRVEDHCEALVVVLEKGVVGEVYNIGGERELTNLQVAKMILKAVGESEDLLRHVADRPGHDRHYALDTTKIRRLGWFPKIRFEEGLAQTIAWYQENVAWWRAIQSGEYKKWVEQNYGRRGE